MVNNKEILSKNVLEFTSTVVLADVTELDTSKFIHMFYPLDSISLARVHGSVDPSSSSNFTIKSINDNQHIFPSDFNVLFRCPMTYVVDSGTLVNTNDYDFCFIGQ